MDLLRAQQNANALYLLNKLLAALKQHRCNVWPQQAFSGDTRATGPHCCSTGRARSLGTAVTTAGHPDNNINHQSLTQTSNILWTWMMCNMDDVHLLCRVMLGAWPRHNMSKDHSLCKHLTFMTIHPCVACRCDVDTGCWHRKNSQISISKRT